MHIFVIVLRRQGLASASAECVQEPNTTLFLPVIPEIIKIDEVKHTWFLDGMGWDLPVSSESSYSSESREHQIHHNHLILAINYGMSIVSWGPVLSWHLWSESCQAILWVVNWSKSALVTAFLTKDAFVGKWHLCAFVGKWQVQFQKTLSPHPHQLSFEYLEHSCPFLTLCYNCLFKATNNFTVNVKLLENKHCKTCTCCTTCTTSALNNIGKG